MKKRKLFVSIVCVLLALLMALSVILTVIPVGAVYESDLEGLIEKRLDLEEQLEKQAALVEELTENHSLVILRKAALDQQIALNRSEIELLTEQVTIYDNMIAGKAQELAEAEEAEKNQSEQLRIRMRSMEENGSYGYLSFIFQSKSIPELLARMSDYADIMEYDRSLETSLRQARSDVETLKKEYETVQKEQNEVCRELDAKKEQLAAQVEAACSLIANLDALTDDAEAEYAAIEQAEQEAMDDILKAMAALEAQRMAYYSAAPAAETGAAETSASASGYSTYTGTLSGGFIWPTDSNIITSNFGYRDQPTAGASTYHQAIDIGAAAGTPIYAVADGQVVTAAANNGLGNYVSIDHGDSVATRYSHMTNYIVQPGEYVTQGQIIGYVGSTGIATGDHLDFAVIQNGQAVNPMDFYS